MFHPDGPVHLLITGDDNLVGFEEPPAFTFDELKSVAEEYGLPYKVDTCDGGWYPPGRHAPYLSKRTVVSDDGSFGVCVPSEPERAITSIKYLVGDENERMQLERIGKPADAKACEKLSGIAQEFNGWRYIENNAHLS